ncbi:MAG: nitroreductase family protein [Clostridiales bacterium]|nr:nitroreductase family protein [Clostridiales bacterium]
MLDAIKNRRSIRKYKPESIPQPVIEAIIQAGMLAPSSKNRQPWKFVVAEGDAKAEAVEIFRKGIEREKRAPFLTESGQHIGGAEYTMKIMEQAPVVIFIANILGEDFSHELDMERRVSEICNVQSIGAAVENMILAATEYGLGSLWICDTYFAQKELNDWMDTEGQLCAALALGYRGENPDARPRKRLEDVVEWRK